jgi:hypothetical protein
LSLLFFSTNFSDVMANYQVETLWASIVFGIIFILSVCGILWVVNQRHKHHI